MTHGEHNAATLRRRAWLTAALCGLVVLAGCVTDEPPATPVDIAPLSSQIGSLAHANADLRAANERLAEANEALRAENERLKAQLRADADAGLAANAKGWLPFEGYVFRQQIARLPGIQPDASTAAKWTEAAGLYAAGGESAMQGVIDSLHSDAAVQAAKIGELSTKALQLERERDEAQGAATLAQKAVQDAGAALASAVAQARRDEASAIRKEQIRRANQGGTVCWTLALLLAAAAIFSPAAKGRFAEVALFFAGASATLFAAARWLGSPWFERAVIAAWATAGAVGIVWLIRRGIAEREAKAKAERDGIVASVVVQALNDFYDAADSGTQSKLDAGLFAKLAAAGPAYAAAVKRIKADCIEAAAATSSSAQQASTQSPNRRAT